ncbi:MAG: hypothetical protein WC804_05445 [Sphingomonas sp.]|jgi:hypothetical protein|uniref:hypothetical protein n=1 Tax=Sphingomonas sp. TaxID=28214 RepID=UPI003564F85E
MLSNETAASAQILGETFDPIISNPHLMLSIAVTIFVLFHSTASRRRKRHTFPHHRDAIICGTAPSHDFGECAAQECAVVARAAGGAGAAVIAETGGWTARAR